MLDEGEALQYWSFKSDRGHENELDTGFQNFPKKRKDQYHNDKFKVHRQNKKGTEEERHEPNTRREVYIMDSGRMNNF